MLVAVSFCVNVDASLRGGVAGFLKDVFDQNMKVKSTPTVDEKSRNQTLDIDPDLLSNVVEKKKKTEDSIIQGQVIGFIWNIFDPKEDAKGDIPADVEPESSLDGLYSNVTTNEDIDKSGGMASNRSDTNNTKCPTGVGGGSLSAFSMGGTKGGQKGSKVGDRDDVEDESNTDDIASNMTTSEAVELLGDMVSNSSETNSTKCPKGVSGDSFSAHGVKGKKGRKKGGKMDVDHYDDDGVMYGKGKGGHGDGGFYDAECTGKGCGESIGGGDWDGYKGEGMNFGKGTELGKGKGKGELDYGKDKGSKVHDDDAYFVGKGKGRGKKG